MYDLEIDAEDELDFIDEYEDEEDQADMEAAIAEAIYASLEEAKRDLATRSRNEDFAMMLEDSEIVLDNYYSGRLILSDDADELLSREEAGVPSFDIKFGLLNSPKVKVTASGIRSIVVPFKGNNRGFNPLKLGKRLSSRYFAMYGEGQAESYKRVTDRTPPSKWIHPGIPPNPIFDAVAAEAQNNLQGEVLEIKKDFD